MSHSKLRGHSIIYVNGEWLYKDTRTPTVDNERPCGHCGKSNTAEGYDGCLGVLPAVMNACCGHGTTDEAYIQYWNGREVRGVDVIKEIEEIKKGDRSDEY
jgi:hypothetical protein